MIALVILGLGLLFIAAALPVGLEYTRQTVDMGTAEAAGEYALEQLELTLRTSKDLYDVELSKAVGGGPWPIRLDNIHRPRVAKSAFSPGDSRREHLLWNTYEPFIKVRPLVMGNIRVGPVPSSGTREIIDDVEWTIDRYLNRLPGFSWPVDERLERDISLTDSWPDLSLTWNPAVPAMMRVFPPIDPVTTFRAEDFFRSEDQYPMYGRRLDIPLTGTPGSGTLTFDQQQSEYEKTLERRVAWTAFYRRISYKGDDGPDGVWFSSSVDIPPDDVAEAPLLYELIIVVTRRTSVNHRFPRQDLTQGNLDAFKSPQAWSPFSPPGDDNRVGTDRLAPTPWLVMFDSDSQALPLVPTTDYIWSSPDADHPYYQERVLLPDNFTDPATLTFRCTREVGVLLPVGSIFIPAVNDQRYVSAPAGQPQLAGFVPSAPESLPIYEVVEVREGDVGVPWEIVVANNGYYPWVASNNAGDTQAWPVWVIPPSFVERGSDDQPVYERTSPVLKVIRRVVTLRELTP